jgi:hypothetical protein
MLRLAIRSGSAILRGACRVNYVNWNHWVEYKGLTTISCDPETKYLGQTEVQLRGDGVCLVRVRMSCSGLNEGVRRRLRGKSALVGEGV